MHFSETTLTSYAGAVPVLQFLNERLKLPQWLGIAVPTTGRARRYLSASVSVTTVTSLSASE